MHFDEKVAHGYLKHPMIDTSISIMQHNSDSIRLCFSYFDHTAKRKKTNPIYDD